MRQVLQTRSGTTVVRDVPAPDCPPGSVLVKSAYSLISSGTERARVAQARQSLLARARQRPDLVKEVIRRARTEGVRSTGESVRRKLSEESPVGYSSSGIVIEVGEAVRGISPSDRVACAGAGHANHAEIVSVPANLCAHVPDGVSLVTASFTTVAAIALHGIRLADVALGERVAVIGCGLVGQLTCRLLKAAGAEIVALDLDDAHLEAAVRSGAHHVLLSDSAATGRVFDMTGGLGADRAIVTAASSSNAAFVLATEIVRDRGTVVVVGDVPVEGPRLPLYRKELTVRVSRSYGPGRYDAEYEERGLDYPIGYVRWTEKRNMEAILNLQARGSLELHDLVDEIVPVGEADRAYAQLIGPPESRPRSAIVLSYGEAALDDAPPTPLSLAGGAPPSRSMPGTGVDRPRIGLIGPGTFATRVLVPALRATDANLEVVGGGGGPSADAARRDLGFRRTAESAKAVIEDPEVDAVVIATRHASHAELTQQALGTNKSVFCEKPLALSQNELDAVLAAAGKSDGILAVGFNRRFSPYLGRTRSFLAEESGPTTVLYRVSAGHVPPDHWVHDLSQGGGRILGEVCHFVDSVAFLVGSPVTAVHASAHGHPDLALQARDNVVVTLRFKSGSIGSIVYASDGAPGFPKERVEVFRGRRTALVNDFRELTLYGKTDARERASVADKGHTAELAAFVQGIRSRVPPVPLAEVANVSLAVLAVVESLRTGSPVRLIDERPE